MALSPSPDVRFIMSGAAMSFDLEGLGSVQLEAGFEDHGYSGQLSCNRLRSELHLSHFRLSRQLSAGLAASIQAEHTEGFWPADLSVSSSAYS